MVETAQPMVIPRVSEEPRFQNRIHNRPLKDCDEVSFLCVPIRLEGELIGTLSVDLPAQPPDLLHERVRVLEIVASMISYDVRSRQGEARRRQALEAENLRLRDALQEQFRPENIIGNSHPMREVYVKIKQVAASNTTVLIRGESGTGKELVASAIHYTSSRAKKPFVKVNCAALNENLLESELFGHEKGAFTGALSARTGRLEEAEGGTLFLDEIGDFSPAIQVKLLRVLQEREYERVGSNRTLKADVRVIAATNQDVEARLSEGLFRQDLYYRINVFPISLPPLRDRKDDILLLADHFVAKYAKKMGKEVRRISTPAINMMLAYHWPGNVRELENCIEYGVLLASDGTIHGHSLPATLQLPAAGESVRQGLLRVRVNLLERDMIADALKSCQGSVQHGSPTAWHHPAHGALQDQEAGHRSSPVFQAWPGLTWRAAIHCRLLTPHALRQCFPCIAPAQHFFPRRKWRLRKQLCRSVRHGLVPGPRNCDKCFPSARLPRCASGSFSPVIPAVDEILFFLVFGTLLALVVKAQADLARESQAASSARGSLKHRIMPCCLEK